MRHLHQFLVPTVLALLSASLASAGEDKIIANPSIAASTLSSDELKRVFLITKTSLSDGTHVEPVIGKEGAAHEEFVKKYLGRSSAALDIYYRSLAFTGKGAMPKSFASDAQVAAYVAKTKGAIGYVSTGTSTPGVKILEIQ